MRALLYSLLAIALSVACNGEPKSNIDVLEERCVTACESIIDYIERCAFASSTDCEKDCDEYAAAGIDNGCEEESEAWINCSDTQDLASV